MIIIELCIITSTNNFRNQLNNIYRFNFFSNFSDDDFHFDNADQPEGDSRPVDLITFKVNTGGNL